MRDVIVDACCYHASLATLLRASHCAAPEAVLGRGAGTYARFFDGEIRFGDVYEPLAEMCCERGFVCRRWSARSTGAWDAVARHLALGTPVMGLLDPFFLPHYWIDFQRTHTQHAIVLWSVNPERNVASISDPADVVRFDGEVPVDVLREAALCEDRGQAWIVLEHEKAIPRVGNCDAELADLGHTLVAGGKWLSSVELARTIDRDLDSWLAAMTRLQKAGARAGVDTERRRCSHMLRGVWNHHHTLRWLAKLLASAEEGRNDVRSAARHVDEAAQGWLVVRNLLMKYGMSQPDSQVRLAKGCRDRLARIVAVTESAAMALGRLRGAAEKDA